MPNCEYCGSEFTARINHGKPQRYCSRACRDVGDREPNEERFWRYVNKNGPCLRPELGPCWLWTGVIDSPPRLPYGKIFLLLPNGRYKITTAHRFAWELHAGPLPKGMFALHHCDNPGCVRPDHLFKGTALDNMLDKTAKDRNGRCGPKNPARGSAHPKAKLTEDEVRSIRGLYSGGATQQSLASRFGVDQTMISCIVLRKTWKHVA
jgi:hypothetical protein